MKSIFRCITHIFIVPTKKVFIKARIHFSTLSVSFPAVRGKDILCLQFTNIHALQKNHERRLCELNGEECQGQIWQDPTEAWVWKKNCDLKYLLFNIETIWNIHEHWFIIHKIWIWVRNRRMFHFRWHLKEKVHTKMEILSFFTHRLVFLT